MDFNGGEWNSLEADRRDIMRIHPFLTGSLILLLLFYAMPAVGAPPNLQPPTQTVKLVFIHHSTGEALLENRTGALGAALANNNYFVSDTNYDWGPDGIGSLTDIGHWYDWFLGPSRDVYLDALYENSAQYAFYTRLENDPGGENQIVMFKSCFPNAYLGGNPDDPPTVGENPLRGNDAWSEYMTVANAKGIYTDLLSYFATRQDKLFIAFTPPALVTAATDNEHATNARAFSNWMVHDWLRGYPYNNVAVFDFFNVLTSSAGDPETNDSGEAGGNHHRWNTSQLEHIQTVSSNVSAYGSDEFDSHPTQAGHLKANAELVPLINLYYHCWQGTGGCPPRFEVRSNAAVGPIVQSDSGGNSVRLGVTSGSSSGQAVDWWLVLYTGAAGPDAWYSYVYPTGWVAGIHSGLQSNLADFSMLDIPGLPIVSGTGTLYFGIDLVQDGMLNLNSARYDWIPVNGIQD
jgi:hypothetical protein